MIDNRKTNELSFRNNESLSGNTLHKEFRATLDFTSLIFFILLKHPSSTVLVSEQRLQYVLFFSVLIILKLWSCKTVTNKPVITIYIY